MTISRWARSSRRSRGDRRGNGIPSCEAGAHRSSLRFGKFTRSVRGTAVRVHRRCLHVHGAHGATSLEGNGDGLPNPAACAAPQRQKAPRRALIRVSGPIVSHWRSRGGRGHESFRAGMAQSFLSRAPLSSADYPLRQNSPAPPNEAVPSVRLCPKAWPPDERHSVTDASAGDVSRGTPVLRRSLSQGP